VFRPEVAWNARFFPALKSTWDLQVQDYLVRPGDRRKLMSPGFRSRGPGHVYQSAVANPDADATTLWPLVKARQFNHAHAERQREPLREVLLAIELEESLEADAERLRKTASALPQPVSDDALNLSVPAGTAEGLPR